MLALLAVAVAPFVAAMPTVTPRQSSQSWCQVLGVGAYDTAYNFTLAAINTTLPNANSTGAPLVISPQAVQLGESLNGLATYASQPGTLDTWPNFSLVKGGLTANEPSSPSCTTVSGGATSGGPVSFLTTCEDAPSPQPAYCGQADTDPEKSALPVLALYTHTDLFSICHQNHGTGEDVVIYNATSGNSLYDLDSCYPVQIHVVE